VTPVPPPAIPCVRVRLIYTTDVETEAGSRFFLSYSGAAPTAGNCITLAGDIAALWNTDLAPIIVSNFSLTEVDVQDIATDSGASGQWTGSHPGSFSGLEIPFSAANNVEYGISRRYRGGKPRMFLPPPSQSAMATGGQWTDTFLTDVTNQVPAFFSGVEALTVGSMGTLDHVNLSYYKGFTNVTNSSGRERAVPTYRAAALVDTVESYIPKREIGSQRRRRVATSP
jgi:hypothetical protein